MEGRSLLISTRQWMMRCFHLPSLPKKGAERSEHLWILAGVLCRNEMLCTSETWAENWSEYTRNINITTFTLGVMLYVLAQNIKQKMQTIQNRASRIITKTRIREAKTNKSINEKAKLEPINVVLHNFANNIWNKIDLNYNQTIKLLYNNQNKVLQYSSSRERCKLNVEPKY